MRNARRSNYKLITIFIILFDVLVQLNVYTLQFSIYTFSLINGDFTVIEDIYSFIFGKKNLNVEVTEKYISNLTWLMLPHLIMIWIKSIVGLRTWCNNFSRKSVESYFMHTFIYHIFSLISNTLIFAV